MSDEILSKVLVLEVRSENMEKALAKVDEAIAENYKATLSIKERMDKQNGAIPHLVEDVAKLEKNQARMEENQKELVLLINTNAISDAKNQTKLKILWGILAALGSVALGLAAKLLFPSH